jgi:hypothetical protein
MTAKAAEPRTYMKVPVSLLRRVKAGAKKRDIPMMQYVEQAVTLMEQTEARV